MKRELNILSLFFFAICNNINKGIIVVDKKMSSIERKTKKKIIERND